jgi:hypothetical protein
MFRCLEDGSCKQHPAPVWSFKGGGGEQELAAGEEHFIQLKV